MTEPTVNPTWSNEPQEAQPSPKCPALAAPATGSARPNFDQQAELLSIAIYKITYIGGHERPDKLIQAEIKKALRRNWQRGLFDASAACDQYVRSGKNVYARNSGNAVKRRIMALMAEEVPNDELSHRRGRTDET